MPDFPRERPVEPGMHRSVIRKGDAGIRRRGGPGLSRKGFDVDLGHRKSADSRSPRPVAVSLELKFDGHLHIRYPVFFGYLGEVFSDIGLIRIIHDDDILGLAPPVQVMPDIPVQIFGFFRIVQHFFQFHPEVSPQCPPGYQDHSAVAPRTVVRIAVRPDIHALLPRLVDQPDDGPAPSPEVGPPCLDMGSQHRSAGPLPHVYEFDDVCQHVGRAGFMLAWHIPHGRQAGGPLMGHVDAVVRDDLFHQSHDLVLVAPDARHILQPGRHTESPIRHGLPHERLHLFYFFRRGQPLEILPHHLTADRIMPDKKRYVRSCSFRGQSFPLPFDVCGPSSAHVGNQGGHALADEIRRAKSFFVFSHPGFFVLHPVIGMAVDIDESRSEHFSRYIDNPLGREFFLKPADGRDFSVLYAHVGIKAGVAGSVQDPSVYEKNVECFIGTV